MTLMTILDSREFPSEFSVTDLHLNLWSLAAFGGRRRSFVLDVGVRIQASEKPVTHVSIGIPFGTEEFECLHSKLTESETASLIFNTDATANQSSIELDGENLAIYQVAQAGSSRQKAYSDNFFSLWDFELAKPIGSRSIGYFRVRFPITTTGKAWQWQKQRLFRSGATVDIRVSDGRSAKGIRDGAQLLHRVRPIERIAAFVMVPAWMHGRTISPSPHYIRLLEGNLWRSYLGRNPEWRTRSRLIVYYWKNKKPGAADHESISPDQPFQIFSDFGLDGHPSRIVTALATSAVTIAGLGAVYSLPLQDWVTGFGDWINQAWMDFSREWWSLTNPISIAILAAGLVAGAIKFTLSSVRLATWLRARFLTTEASIFRMLSAR